MFFSRTYKKRHNKKTSPLVILIMQKYREKMTKTKKTPNFYHKARLENLFNIQKKRTYSFLCHKQFFAYDTKILFVMHKNTFDIKSWTILNFDINLADILAHYSQSKENTARAEPYRKHQRCPALHYMSHEQ